VVVYLIRRNSVYDRINAMMWLPMVLQEVVQTGLWMVLDESNHGNLCGFFSPNFALSTVEMMLVTGLGMWWSHLLHLLYAILLMQAAGMTETESNPIMDFFDCGREQFTKVWPKPALLRSPYGRVKTGVVQTGGFLFFMCFYHTIRAFYSRKAYWEGSYFESIVPGPTCTTVGPKGFQIWPMIVFEHWMLKYVYVILFGFSVSIYNLLPNPSFMPAVIECFGAIGALLFFTIGDQWASVWSCAVGVGCVTALVEPWLFHTFRILDPEALAPEGEALRQGPAFKMAWHRFIVFKFTPWDDAPSAPDFHAPKASSCCGSHGCGAHEEVEKIMKPPSLMAMM